MISTTCYEIAIAHTSFKWTHLASRKAAVTLVVVGISNHAVKTGIRPLTMQAMLLYGALSLPRAWAECHR
ncbi:MAG: DNA methyltransferase [Steroidobacteraceae bacterium]